MKTALLLATLLILLLTFVGCASRPATQAFRKPTVVEAACGECKFGMKGKDCDLAVRIQGRAYFVDGVDEKSLGDPHAPDGICLAVRPARVTGTIRNARFSAASFELLPAKQP